MYGIGYRVQGLTAPHAVRHAAEHAGRRRVRDRLALRGPDLDQGGWGVRMLLYPAAAVVWLLDTQHNRQSGFPELRV